MSEPASSTAYPDGPLLVRGDVGLTVGGEPFPLGRATVALCRCGGSSILPLCDGTHKVTGFETGEHEPHRCRLAPGTVLDYEDDVAVRRPSGTGGRRS